ncbi:MAG: hypothetical protein MUE67_10830 [Anaerolineales bacterium]|jgi:hypothetical protein|nr:hypothetical protein [Anaerolineales bacterium]
MPAGNSNLESAWLLISRLERLSADSVWAHRASGLRGALLKAIEQVEQASSQEQSQALDRLSGVMGFGYRVLEHAAKELLR